VSWADLLRGGSSICPGTYLVSLKFWKMELGSVFGVSLFPFFELLFSRSGFSTVFFGYMFLLLGSRE
jgi:hypothetical protein